MVQPPHQHALEVLYEDNHLLVINKPAMLATMGVAAEKPSLLRMVKQYVRQKYNKPGNVYLGIVSRLDVPVTGVVVIARTSKAASRLSKAFRLRQVEKIYWAVVEGHIEPPMGQLEHYLRKDERHRRMHTTHADCPGAQHAWLEYSVMRTGGHFSLVEVRPGTGRKHQIRVQLAKHGNPICGDIKYGSSSTFSYGIGLHARRLAFDHPVRNERVEFEAPLPAAWQEQRFVKRLLP